MLLWWTAKSKMLPGIVFTRVSEVSPELCKLLFEFSNIRTTPERRVELKKSIDYITTIKQEGFKQ